MANRQLVDYIKEQLSHRMDINAIRTVLLQQGWQPSDVEQAIEEAYHTKRSRDKKEHHTNFVAIAVAAIIVVILAAALLIVVFRQPDEIIVPPPPIIDPDPELPQLTGWAVCAHETDSTAKDSCYYDLNEQEENFDCDLISDSDERRYCYRAKEAVVLERYAAED